MHLSKDILTPKTLPEERVDEILLTYESWLIDHVNRLENPAREVVYKEAKEQLLKITSTFLDQSKRHIEDGLYKRSQVINLSSETISQAITAYSQLLDELEESADQWANETAVRVGSIYQSQVGAAKND